ncbi:MAG: PH domain-containing protein [Alphaproteobacteria bacterium]|nr:PH domain-containing protein [Alphaproteobacteria bacterium]
MSYVDDTMQKDERVLVRPELHWVNYVAPYMAMVGALAAIVIDMLLGFSDHGLLMLALVMAVYAGWGLLEVKFREMAVTNKRVVTRKGVVASDGDEMKNMALTSIEVEQTVMGRILGYGNVCFASAGSGRLVRLVFARVKNPRALKAQIEDAIEEN